MIILAIIMDNANVCIGKLALNHAVNVAGL